jgi:5,10-methylenetetrahydromethanopterin reductase
MELWLHTFAIPGRVVEVARQAEAWGFDGLLVADSQSLTADVWIELALAGAATSRLRLGPGVTNPATRHLAVTASAAATLHEETGGRAVVGFARGDSALSQLGLQPPSIDAFADDVRRLQGLLRGEEVRLANGTASSLHWIAGRDMVKVPVHVAATGPRAIAATAGVADGLDLTVGGELERIRWGVDQVRAAPGGERASVGAYVNVGVDEDPAAARQLVRGSVTTFARFSRDNVGDARLESGYDKDRHGTSSSDYARRLDDAFVDRFAAVGPAAQVAERLAEIAAAGVERIVVVPGSIDADRAAMARSNDAFAATVLPALRAR